MDTCGICLEECVVPCRTIHEDDKVVCRQVFCEECLIKSNRCPMCNNNKKNYMILPWLMDFDKVIQCRNCDWSGTTTM